MTFQAVVVIGRRVERERSFPTKELRDEWAAGVGYGADLFAGDDLGVYRLPEEQDELNERVGP